MCSAITAWKIDGEEGFIRCSQDCEGLCCYHRKMKQGLITPEYSDETQNRPVRVFTKEETLWTL